MDRQYISWLLGMSAALVLSVPAGAQADEQPAAPASSDSAPASDDFFSTFSWTGGIEDTFIPQRKPGLRPLDEYALTQHYEQWRADIDRAASLGVKKLRWGVPWYRVETKPGVYDWSWTDKVLDYMVNQRHIDPIVDIVHYGTPLWMTDSFVDPTYPERVASFARAFAARYGKLVRYYTPLNEPTVNADFAGNKGEWPPYLHGDSGYLRVLLPIARGVQLSTQAIRQADPDCVIFSVEAMRYVAPDADPNAVINEFYRDMLAYDLVRGRVDNNYPLYDWLIKNGVTDGQLAELKNGAVQTDVLGVNFYPWSIVRLPAAAVKPPIPLRQHGRLLLEVIRNCYGHSHKPIFITETSATGDTTKRALWMSETIDAVRAARAQGIPVLGYTWFPLISMIDWKYRTGDKPVADYLLHLGLWDSRFNDRGILVREPTELVDNYRDWVNRGMTPVCADRSGL